MHSTNQLTVFKKKFVKIILISLYGSDLLYTTMLHEESTWRPRCAQFNQPIRKEDQGGQTLSLYGAGWS